MKDFNKILYDILLKIDSSNSATNFNINSSLNINYFEALKNVKSSNFKYFEEYFSGFFMSRSRNNYLTNLVALSSMSTLTIPKAVVSICVAFMLNLLPVMVAVYNNVSYGTADLSIICKLVPVKL